MYEERVRYALDTFVEEDYFLSMQNEYHLKEEKDSGKSDLFVKIGNDNLCIYDFDNKKKCNFLRPDKKFGLQKSVDHMIFEQRPEGWILHMIEMKSSVGNKTWIDIKLKVRASYLNAYALAKVLGIKIQEIYTYTTYEEEKFGTVADTTSPKLFVPPLGKVVVDYKKDEWDKNQITIELGKKITLPHYGIKMERGTDGLVLKGTLVL